MLLKCLGIRATASLGEALGFHLPGFMLTKDGIVTVDGRTLRVGTSRFLSQRNFLLYKLALAAYFLYWAIYWREVKDYTTGRYLTHWTWYATTSYFVVSAASAFLCWNAMRKVGTLPVDGPVRSITTIPSAAPTAKPSKPALPVALRWLQLSLWSTVCVASLTVVVIFWGALYNGAALTTVDIQAHAVVGAIMLLDQFLIADEFKLRTIIFGQIYGAIYIAFNVGWYYLAPREERLIYFILDWDEKPLVASIYALGCVLVLGPILGVLHYGVYRLREYVYDKRLARIGRGGQTPAIELKTGTEV